MEDGAMIESPTSLIAIENAKVMQENVRKIKKWDNHTIQTMEALGVDRTELTENYLREKENFINQALRTAFVEKEIIELVGNVYYTQIEHLKRNTKPTSASCLDGIPKREMER